MNTKGNAILIILGILAMSSIFLTTMLPWLTRGEKTNLLTAYQADVDNAFDVANYILQSPTGCNRSLTGANLVLVAPGGAPWTATAGAKITIYDNNTPKNIVLKGGQIYNQLVSVNKIQLYDLGQVSVGNVFHYAALTISMSNVNAMQPFSVTKTIYFYIIAVGGIVSQCDISAQVSTMDAAFTFPVVLGAPVVTGNMIATLNGAATHFDVTGNPYNLYYASGLVGQGIGTIAGAGCVPDDIAGGTYTGFSFGFQSPGPAATIVQATDPGPPTSRCVTSSTTWPLIWTESGSAPVGPI